jgi:hypothetical protein
MMKAKRRTKLSIPAIFREKVKDNFVLEKFVKRQCEGAIKREGGKYRPVSCGGHRGAALRGGGFIDIMNELNLADSQSRRFSPPAETNISTNFAADLIKISRMRIFSTP